MELWLRSNLRAIDHRCILAQDSTVSKSTVKIKVFLFVFIATQYSSVSVALQFYSLLVKMSVVFLLFSLSIAGVIKHP
jgi:hypothetical protein